MDSVGLNSTNTSTQFQGSSQDRAAALVTAYTDTNVVTSVDTTGLAKHAVEQSHQEADPQGFIDDVASHLRVGDRSEFYQAVAQVPEPSTFDQISDSVSEAGDWVAAKPGEFREWHDGYSPDSVGGHVLDAVSTLGVGVLDLAEFAGNVIGTGYDLSPAGQLTDLVERGPV